MTMLVGWVGGLDGDVDDDVDVDVDDDGVSAVSAVSFYIGNSVKKEETELSHDKRQTPRSLPETKTTKQPASSRDAPAAPLGREKRGTHYSLEAGMSPEEAQPSICSSPGPSSSTPDQEGIVDQLRHPLPLPNT
jgi:hypothetical protein